MSVDILGLTDTGELRAVLGISVIEAPDQHFIDFGLEQDLKLDLLGWRSDYVTIITEGTEGTPTTAQLKKYLLLRKYAKYFCSAQVTVAGESFIPQMVSDGNSQFKRYAIRWEELTGRLNSMASSTKAELVDLADSTASAAHTVMGKSTPDYDPVSNV